MLGLRSAATEISGNNILVERQVADQGNRWISDKGGSKLGPGNLGQGTGTGDREVGQGTGETPQAGPSQGEQNKF